MSKVTAQLALVQNGDTNASVMAFSGAENHLKPVDVTLNAHKSPPLTPLSVPSTFTPTVLLRKWVQPGWPISPSPFSLPGRLEHPH